jgi:5,10-methenyltetrahydrofolate synthetase
VKEKLSKALCRKKARQLLREQAQLADWAIHVRQIQHHLQETYLHFEENLKATESSSWIWGLFSPLPDEPQVDWRFIPALSRSFPAEEKAADKIMRGYKLKSEDPRVSVMSVMAETEKEEKTPWVTPQIIVIPGLAFQADGWRLGRGAGWYDQLLAHNDEQVIKIGICFEFQKQFVFEVEEHDVRLDYLLSEKGLISCETSATRKWFR